MSKSHRSTGRSVRIEALEARRLLAAAGSLDPSFSGDGKTTIASVGETLIATDVAVQSDGKTVVVGRSETPAGVTQFAVARFNLDGSLDTTFSGGLVRTQLSDLNNSYASAVAIAPDGKIVVVGTADVSSGFNEPELAVARYNTNGSLDNSFDDNGVLSRDLGDASSWTYGEDVSVQLDGRIIVVGRTYRIPDDDFFVHALSASGADEGTFYPAFGEEDGAVAVKQDGQNRVYVTGNIDKDAGTDGFTRRVGLQRITLDGLDSSGDYKVSFSLPGRSITSVQDLILQTDGKVVIAGHSLSLDGRNDFFIARFTATGALDTTFGGSGNGFRVTDLGGDDVVAGMVISPSGGGFIVSGRSGGTTAAIKYTDTGAIDTTFGTAGIVRISGFNGTANIARGPGRRVALAGGTAFSTARLLTAGANLVTVTPFDSVAAEGTVNPALFVVSRTETLPTPTRVFFTISGTANGRPLSLPGTRDYTLDTLIQPIPSFGVPNPPPYVDIPAGEKFAFVTLTTINDTRVEGTETAIFTIAPNAAYETGAPASVRIDIRDDDLFDLSLGTSTVTAPPKKTDVGQEVQTTVTWTVPSGDWRQLASIDLRLRDRDDDDAFTVFHFDEATRTFSTDQSAAAARYGPVTLVPAKSTFQAAGPTAPTVTVTFTYRFNAGAAKRRFVLDVAASNDAEAFSGFSQVGQIHVHKENKGHGGHGKLFDDDDDDD